MSDKLRGRNGYNVLGRDGRWGRQIGCPKYQTTTRQGRMKRRVFESSAMQKSTLVDELIFRLQGTVGEEMLCEKHHSQRGVCHVMRHERGFPPVPQRSSGRADAVWHLQLCNGGELLCRWVPRCSFSLMSASG